MFKDKRGILDDVFDYLFLVLVGIFMLFFLSNFLNAPIENGKEFSLKNLAKFHYQESAIQNIRVQESSGLQINHQNVEHLMQQSKVLGGKVITSCSDYFSRVDCTADAVKISTTGCAWNSEINRCSLAFKEPAEIGRLPGGVSS
ncbi:MAG TPA: hypothetical protein VJI32_04610 [Candidatus Nanoarchaeia archaeon]|nr:hypothetical protein [Candidatus Nanoarchaeia archaeon]